MTRSFGQIPVAEWMKRLGSRAQGLTDEEARAALVKFGPNRIQSKDQQSSFALFLSIFGNPLVLILLLASLVSASLGETVNAIIIVTILTLSSVLEFSQTYRSSRAALRLRQAVSTKVTVFRSGEARDLPLEEVVPGDVQVLSAGSLVAGDGFILSARDLSCLEAALTGESMPAEKRPNEDSNVVFMGTSVASGVGQALLVNTGTATEFGKVAQRLLLAKPITEFERGIHSFGMLIMRSVMALVAFVFLTSVVFHRPPLESLLFSVALAVGLTPEFLPMIISVTLSAGAARLARSKVIVKSLSAIENFGSIDILCSDKTGTLTLGKIKLERYVNLDGGEHAEVLLFASLNSGFQSGIRSPMDEAVMAHVHPVIDEYQKLDEIPFDFERRRLSVVLLGPQGRVLVTKGAPESVDPLCSHYQLGQRVLAFDDGARQRLRATFQELSQQGYRVLSVAKKSVDEREHYGLDEESNLCLVGLAAFLDPAREDVSETLGELHSDGIRVKILTGDNEWVAQKICQDVGLEVGEVLLGRDVDNLSDDALGPVAEQATLFARLSPSQKNRVILALRARGHVVGYLGDGINDAPSLRSADIGISVEGAVDVAKDAADIILLDAGLRPVHLGVMEGRRSFGNIMKYILMGTSSNFGNMFSMAGASLFLPFLPMLPAQILLNTLLYDLSQLGIPADHVDEGYLRKPRRWSSTMIREFMLLMGPVSSLFDFITFGFLIYFFQAGPKLFQTGWFLESLTTQVLVLFVIRTSGRPWLSRPHPALVAGAFSVLLLASLLPFTLPGRWLGLVVPPGSFYGFVLAIAFLYLMVVEVIKNFFYKRHGLI